MSLSLSARIKLSRLSGLHPRTGIAGGGWQMILVQAWQVSYNKSYWVHFYIYICTYIHTYTHTQIGLYSDTRLQLMVVMIKCFWNMFLIFHAFSLKNKCCVHIAFSSQLIRLFVSGIIVLLLNLLSSGPMSRSYELQYLDWRNMNCLVSVRSGTDETACTQL